MNEMPDLRPDEIRAQTDFITITLEHYKRIQARRRELELERQEWQRATGYFTAREAIEKFRFHG